jgi:hypothetical protein
MKLWEIRRRRAYIDKHEARGYLHQMRIVNAGFNGGEAASSLQMELRSRAFPPLLTLEDKKKPRNWLKNLIQNIPADN